MSDLEQWLSQHGLQQYAKAFADNDIDLDVLRHLTDEDLEKLGLSLGHRRKLLGALQAVPVAPSHALAIVRPALATITEPGVGLFVSELYRVQGLCLLHNANARDEAMHSLRAAVSVSRQQGATLLELRAALSLARAATAIDGRATDLEPLREVCAGLPAEFDAADLEEARALVG